MFEMLRVLLLPSLLLPPDPGAGPGHSSARLPISPVYTGNAGHGSWDGIAPRVLATVAASKQFRPRSSAVSIAECYVCEETGMETRGFCDRRLGRCYVATNSGLISRGEDGFGG